MSGGRRRAAPAGTGPDRIRAARGEGPGPGIRPDPPDGARHLVVVVLDSLRHDSLVRAAPAAMARLGEIQLRYSYATWTAPSHYNLLTGLLPHPSPQHVYASDYYKSDFLHYADRLGVPDLEFSALLPSLHLPSFLKWQLGYTTHALVSMPVLNPMTGINRDFDTYELMPSHNDFAGMLDRLNFPGDRPSFHLLNVGETHYPYAIPGDDPKEWPRISGVHGLVRRLDSDPEHAATDAAAGFFDASQMSRLHERQMRAAAYADQMVARLLDLVPANTWVVVTSDHGELFGEDGYFGHGPISHEKVLEVPFVEGLAR